MNSQERSIHFLLVDDLEENLVALGAILKRDNLILLKARSGEEALELLLRHEVALALLDVQMPGMDGFELAELMRGNERTRHIPIIFLTAGSADGQRRFQGYEAGAVDFIHKPIEADVLRSKANVFFELYQQRLQIAVQRDALAEADRRKNEFLAMLGHELRNPLAALGSGLNLLKRQTGTEVSDPIREQMGRQLFHLCRLVDDLLDISRISEGKILLQKERIELQDILRTAIEANQPGLEAAHHEFRTELPQEPVWLDADHTRMAQVVGNLLNNAIKYTPNGGTIVLAAKQKDDRVEIEVKDNGIGIPAEMQSRIFDIFSQVEGHRLRSAGGLGLGLSLVRQLVVLHEGSITVESNGSDKGSTFRVSIPLCLRSTEIDKLSKVNHTEDENAIPIADCCGPKQSLER